MSRCRVCGTLHGPPACRRAPAASRGYDAAWQRTRLTHLANEPRCRICGAAATLVDHIVPLAAGGRTEVGNLQSLCIACHAAKTAADGRNRGVRIL